MPEETGRNGDGSQPEGVRGSTIPKTGALTDKSVLVKVTGENGTTMLTYEIELQRGGDVVAPGTASLSALSLTDVTLDPAFTSGTIDYTANVASTVASTTVKATAANGATAVITPPDADASTDGHQVNLAVDAKTPITIVVTGPGMTASTYKVIVTRRPSTPTAAEPGLTLNPPENLVIREGEVETYTMVLTTAPTADVTVEFPDDALGDVSLSRTSATFTTTNWSTPQTVNVLAADDEDQSDDMVTITHTITSTAEAYTDLPTVGLMVTVTDDDKTAGLTVSSEGVTVIEGAATGVTYTVALAAVPTADVTVAVSVVETGDDAHAVTVAPASLTFTATNWAMAQTVTVKAGEDDDAAHNMVTLRHTVTAYGRTVVSRTTVTVTVTDDDVAGLMISATAMELGEGGSASYDVQLATKPTANVTVTIVGFAESDVSVNPSGFTFTVANWNRVQTVMLSAAADDDGDVESPVTLVHTAAGADYGSVTADVVVQVKEAAIPAVVVSHTALTIVEGSVGEQYRLTLTQAPASGETVTVTVGSPADIGTSTTSARLDASNWSTGVKVRVTSPDDGATEGDQRRTVTHTVASSGAVYATVTAVSNVDVMVKDPS